MYWAARNSKGRQCNKEIREIIVRDPQINMRYFIIFLNCELQCAHWDVLQGPNKLKNYRLRWLSKPLRVAKFESLWIQVCSIVAVSRIPGAVFCFFWVFWQSFLNDSCSDSLLLNTPSMLAAFPFYSVILGFRIPLIPLLWLLGVPEPLLCQPFLTTDSFFVSHSFLLLMHFPQKLLVDFPFWSVPRELTSNLSFFKASTPYLFRFSFFRLPFLLVNFPEWADSIFARLKVFPTTSLRGSSFWVSWGTSHLFMNC